MTLSPGTKLGHYEIHFELGVGGMGEVYRAHDSRLNRDVAIKILPKTFLLRFLRAVVISPSGHVTAGNFSSVVTEQFRKIFQPGSPPSVSKARSLFPDSFESPQAGSHTWVPSILKRLGK